MYLNDAAFPHIIDGKLLIIDGVSLKLEGMLGTAFVAHTALSPDQLGNLRIDDLLRAPESWRTLRSN